MTDLLTDLQNVREGSRELSDRVLQCFPYGKSAWMQELDRLDPTRNQQDADALIPGEIRRCAHWGAFGFADVTLSVQPLIRCEASTLPLATCAAALFLQDRQAMTSAEESALAMTDADGMTADG